MTADESPPFGAHLIDATTVAVSGEIDVYSAPDLTAPWPTRPSNASS